MLPALLAAFLLQAGPQEQKDFWTRDALLGDWGGIRPPLEEVGLTWTVEYTGEIISNVSGGVHRDVGADLLLDWVIDADLEKILGWTGGSARINPLWIAGDGVAGDVGDITKVSNITATGGVRVFEAWLQQKLLEGGFSIRAGLLAADQEFALTPSSALFYNSVFGGPVYLTPNIPWPLYPVGALGVRVRCEPAKGFYLMGAVYDGDPGTEESNRSGFNIHLNHRDGAFAIGGGGYTFDDDLPATVKIGAFYHSADFTKFSTGRQVSGLGGVYGTFHKLVYKEGPLPGLLEYHFRAGFSQEDRSFVSFGMNTGLRFTGLIPGRDSDVFGLGWIYARISDDFADAQPNPGPWSYESVIEVTYKFMVTPAWDFQPDLQYVMHPGGTSLVRNALVLGLRIDIFF